MKFSFYGSSYREIFLRSEHEGFGKNAPLESEWGVLGGVAHCCLTGLLSMEFEKLFTRVLLFFFIVVVLALALESKCYGSQDLTIMDLTKADTHSIV
jgi:hypothetical protein